MSQATDDFWSKFKCPVCGGASWRTYRLDGYGPGSEQTCSPGRAPAGNDTKYVCATCGKIEWRKETP